MKLKVLFICACALAFTLNVSAQAKKRTVTKRPVAAAKKATKPAVVAKPNLVDLGLPSGTKWADRNLGASSTTSYGNYYAFGETSPKQIYTNENYTFKADLTNIAGTEYDAATKKYGKGWQIPTKEQWEELLGKCTKTLTLVNNQFVLKFTGENGNYIYLPFPKNDMVKFGDAAKNRELNNAATALWENNSDINFGIREMKKYGYEFYISMGWYRIDRIKDFFQIYGAISLAKSGKIKEYFNRTDIMSNDGVNDQCGLPIRPVYLEKTNE